MAALAREGNNKSTSRAGSQGAKVPIKLEDKDTGPSRLKDRGEQHYQEGLAPNMPKCPMYLSGHNSDII